MSDGIKFTRHGFEFGPARVEAIARLPEGHVELKPEVGE